MFFQQIAEYTKSQCKEKTFPQEKKNIKTLDWNSSGQYLATGDTTIKIWNFDGNNIKKQTDIKQGSDQLECLLFHPTNPDLLAAVTRQHVRIWDLKSKSAIRQEKKEFQGPATWHPSGNVLACASKHNKENQISFFDLVGKNDQHVLYQTPKEKSDKHQVFEMKCMQYDPLGDIFVVGGVQNNSGVFQIMNANQPELPALETIDAHQAAITSISFSKEGNYMATAGADALILLWQLPELLCVASLMSVESEVRSLSFSFDEKWLSVVGSEELLYIFSVEKCIAGFTDHIDTVKCEGKSPQSVVYHPSKPVIAFVCQDSKDSVVHLYAQQGN